MAGFTKEFVNCPKRHICFSGVQVREKKGLSPSSVLGAGVLKVHSVPLMAQLSDKPGFVYTAKRKRNVKSFSIFSKDMVELSQKPVFVLLCLRQRKNLLW